MTNAREADDLAAPLDAMLIDAGRGTTRRFLPDRSTVRFFGKLLQNRRDAGQRLATLAGELGRIAAGWSVVSPAKGDRRFADDAWQNNPFLRRVLQAYLASAQTAEELVAVADLDWRDERRVRFVVQNLIDAAAPSNIPLVNPASAKAAIDTGGLSLARGAASFVRDMRSAPRVPEMVDRSGFDVGGNIATTPGSVVFRSEVLELIQYAPQTVDVRSVPLLFVPPTINKFYVIDLAPGRSIVEYLLQSGQQVFMISWRNPDARHASWGLATYVKAVLDALDAVERVTGSDRTVLGGACSGGIIASIAAAVLAGSGKLDRLAAMTLLVTVLDQRKAGDAAAMSSPRVAAAAKAASQSRGFLDGRQLAEMFAWLRPNDLIWNYWVSNYLCGGTPPSFDILFWNADTTRMAAQLHADFIDVSLGNQLVQSDALAIDGIAVDLSKVDVDAYVVAGIADHITPWENCYRTTAMLGGDKRFVLSRSGHIAALVNPPTNAKATYQLNPDNVPNAKDWLKAATTEQGSWWPHWSTWLGEHSGPDKPAPTELGGGGLSPLADAPGTYVHQT